jgi:hypothetical protein
MAMTPEERDIITNFIARVSGQGSAGQPGGFGSVPSTAPALPPVDREADALIADQFGRFPEARYRLTQLAFVQEHALAEAQNRLKRMEWELQQAQQTAQEAQQQAQQAAAQPQPSRGFLGGLFGGSAAPQQPPAGVWGQGGPAPNQAPPQWQQQPPPPQYPPSYQPGMFQRQGSGFLGSALTTAAGVAGGVVAGNVLMDMFSSHRGGMFGGGESALPVEGAAASPWGGAGALPEPPVPPNPGYVDQGSWTTPDQTAQSGDNAWAQPEPQADPSSWADNSGGGGDWAADNSGNDDDNFA